MRQLGDEAGSDVLSKATGPDYSKYSSLLPDTSSPTYQTTRSWAQHLNPFSDVDAFDAGTPLPYDEAPKLNAKFQQPKAALAAHIGAVGTGGQSDPDRAYVLDALDQAIHAPDPESFFAVLHRTENGLRARAGQAPLPTPKSYLPADWARPMQTPYYVAPVAMKDDAGNAYYRDQNGQLVRVNRATQRSFTRTDLNQGWVYSSVPTSGAR